MHVENAFGLKDMATEEYISYSNWKPGSGNNNCAFVITGEEGQTGKWGDLFCSEQSPRLVSHIFDDYLYPSSI